MMMSDRQDLYKYILGFSKIPDTSHSQNEDEKREIDILNNYYLNFDQLHYYFVSELNCRDLMSYS